MTEPDWDDLLQWTVAWLEEGKVHVAELMKKRQELLQDLEKIDSALQTIGVPPTNTAPAATIDVSRSYRSLVLLVLRDARVPLPVGRIAVAVNSLRMAGQRPVSDSSIRSALNKFVAIGEVRKTFITKGPGSGFVYERIRKQDDQPRDDQREERGAGQDRDSGRVPSSSSDDTPASSEDSGR